MLLCYLKAYYSNSALTTEQKKKERTGFLCLFLISSLSLVSITFLYLLYKDTMSRSSSHPPKIHQRRISLSTACPPNLTKQDPRTHTYSSSLIWCQRLWASRLVRWLAYLYVFGSMLFCFFQLMSPSTEVSSLRTDGKARDISPLSTHLVIL